MARHTKNAQTRPFFTYEERRKYLPDWGTQKERIGGDSLLDFGVCPLCLKPWVNPLSCQGGHVYCKECIYTCLLTQKQDIAKAMELYEAKKRQREANDTKAKDEAHQKEVEDFVENETGAVTKKAKMSSMAAAASKPDAKEGRTSSGVVVTPGARGHEGLLKSRSELRCFWVPDLTPQSEETLEEPSKETQCPQGQHALRLKQLFVVNPTCLPGVDPNDQNAVESNRYQCPSCHKTLTRATKASASKSCGHLFCQKCLDGVLKEEKACYSCGKACNETTWIKIQAGGTGFAAHGEKLMAQKQKPVVAIS